MDGHDAVRFVVAHLFQRAGRRALSESELANAMSLDLKWYPPKDARKLVASLAREGHLRRTEDGELEPAMDVREVQVPLGFRPSPDLVRGGVPESVAAAEGGIAGAAGGHDPGSGAAPPSPGPAASAASPGAHMADAPQASDAQNAAGDAAPVDDADHEEATTSLGVLLDAIAERTGEDAGVWVQRMDAVIQASADALTPEAALLLAAAGAGVDVKSWIPVARAAL